MFANFLLTSMITLAGLNPTPSAPDALNGPGIAVTRVAANSIDAFDVVFVGGLDAIVTVVGDGDTDLDLLVFDENGNLIAEDRGFTDRCAVRWVPSWTGRFRLKVVNLGRVYNRYTLRHN